VAVIIIIFRRLLLLLLPLLLLLATMSSSSDTNHALSSLSPLFASTTKTFPRAVLFFPQEEEEDTFNDFG
jgi:hypothetical protein